MFTFPSPLISPFLAVVPDDPDEPEEPLVLPLPDVEEFVGDVVGTIVGVAVGIAVAVAVAVGTFVAAEVGVGLDVEPVVGVGDGVTTGFNTKLKFVADNWNSDSSVETNCI